MVFASAVTRFNGGAKLKGQNRGRGRAEYLEFPSERGIMLAHIGVHACRHACLSVCLSVNLSAGRSVGLSVCLYVCLYVYTDVFLLIPSFGIFVSTIFIHSHKSSISVKPIKKKKTSN